MEAELLSLIQAAVNPQQGEAAGNAIISFRRENPAAFVSAVLGIVKSNQVPDQAKAYAIILCWQMFPEELSDLPNDAQHPFDAIGEDKVTEILTTSLDLISAGNKTYSHLAATLFGRVAALQLHRKPDLPLVSSLLAKLQGSTSEESIVAISIALAKLCQSALPEQEEVEQVLTAVFAVLGNCQSPTIAAHMINVLQVVLIERDDLLEDAGFVSLLFMNLLRLTSVGDTLEGVLACWNIIGEANLPLLLPVLEQLLSLVIGVLQQGEGNELLCQASLLLKKLLEIPTLTEELSEQFTAAAAPAYQSMIEALLKVICSVESGDCDLSEDWGRHIAAFGALRQLAVILPDEVLVPLAATAAGMLGSQEFGARYGGLALMNAVVVFAESSMVIAQYAKVILERVEDPVPRVRYMAVKCLKDGILKGTTYNPTDDIKAQLLPLSQAIFPVHSHLSDVPQIARTVAKLMAALVEIQGFPNTEFVLKALVEQAIAMGAHNINRPFSAVEVVVDKGQADVVRNYFPFFVELLHGAVEQNRNVWLVRELQETFQAYLIRFGPELGAQVSPLADLLIRIAQLNNQFSTEVLVTLGILVQRVGGPTLSLVPTIVERCMAALNMAGDYSAIYAASMCLTFIVNAGDLGEPMLAFMEQLVKVIEDQDMPTETRMAVVDAIAALAESNPALYARVVTNVMGKIATFCMLLDLVWQDNQTEGQLLATGLGKCILQSLKVTPGQPGLQYVAMAKNWLASVVDTEDIMERLCRVALDVVDHITANYKNNMLEIIQDCEDVGAWIVGQREVPNFRDQCQKILTGLGYQE